MPDSTATAAPTVAVSDTARPPPSITLRTISITVENLPEKSSALATALVREPRLRESRLRENAAIK